MYRTAGGELSRQLDAWRKGEVPLEDAPAERTGNEEEITRASAAAANGRDARRSPDDRYGDREPARPGAGIAADDRTAEGVAGGFDSGVERFRVIDGSAGWQGKGYYHRCRKACHRRAVG